MKGILIALIVLAGGKLAIHEHLRRQATYDTIVNAYRAHAINACRQQASLTRNRNNLWQPNQNAPAIPAIVKFTIGDPDLSVPVWQTTHKDWAARYSNPYMRVQFANRTSGQTCIYDIKNGVAYMEQPRTHGRRTI